MAIAAALAGLGAALGGLWGSFRFDTPTGPTIVVAALVILVASAAIGAVKAGRRADPGR
jgi:zinc transport system permease protein